MKTKILAVVLGVLLIAVNLFAADGDLIVNGKLGVGLTPGTNPSVSLHVQSEITTGFHLNNKNGVERAVFEMEFCPDYTCTKLNSYTAGGGNWGKLVLQSGGGNVGIGTTSPDSIASNVRTLSLGGVSATVSGGISMQINGAVQYYHYVENGLIKFQPVGSNNFSFTSGNVTVNGDLYASSYSGSDICFKTNITPIENALDKISALNGVSYDWKIDEFKDKGFEDSRQIGVIAQDVEKVLPELVKTDSQGYKAVSYEKLTAVLIEAVKEQQKMIEDLKQTIEQIKAKQ